MIVSKSISVFNCNWFLFKIWTICRFSRILLNYFHSQQNSIRSGWNDLILQINFCNLPPYYLKHVTLGGRINFTKPWYKILMVLLNDSIFFQFNSYPDTHITIYYLLMWVNIVILRLTTANFKVNFSTSTIGYAQLWVYEDGLRVIILKKYLTSTKKEVIEYWLNFLRACWYSTIGFMRFVEV